MIKLTKDYIKVRPITSTLAKLINYWEEDRCATECEYLYDLQCSDDFKHIVDMYAVGGAVSAFNIHDGFWWGGCNFPYDDDAMCDFFSKGFDAKSMGKIVFKPFVEDEKTWEWILGEIEDRITGYLAVGIGIPKIESYYGNIIDVEKFAEDRVKNTREGKLKGINVDGHVLNTILPIVEDDLIFVFETEMGDKYKVLYNSEDDIIPRAIHKICSFITMD